MLYRTLCVLASATALVLAAGSAAAGIIGTYVDATMVNTTPSSAFSAVESDTDNLWHLDTTRAYCRNGDVMVTQSSAETAPMLTTTVSGLVEQHSDNPAARLTAQEIAQRVQQAQQQRTAGQAVGA